MSKLPVFAVLAACVTLAANVFAAPPGKGIQVTPDEANRRVDITIDGKPFTSYVWPTTLKKPVLYPIVDADGVTVTRGYPLEPRPGERIDHPHHAGLWFNHSNVNGFDFWNNSEAIKPDARSKMGSIVFNKIVSSKSGANRGELVTDSTWITGTGQTLFEETTRIVFSRSKDALGEARVIDRISTLQALDHAVFHDDKDGMLGLRVANWLELPTAAAGVYTDSNGVATKVAPASSAATGDYLTSEGLKGDAAWGTRGRWCTLTGHTGDHTDTIAIFDNPKNPGYPTYWHARGYGLFAVNPLSPKGFDPKQPAMNFTLEKGQSATFRYRIVIYDHTVTPDELNKEADAFAAEYK
jgi:hypothetical protein